MNLPRSLPALALITALLLPGALSAVPPELTVLQQQYEKLSLERVTMVHETAEWQLNARYLEAVERVISTTKAAGDLPGVLALEAEKKKSVTDEKKVPEDDSQTLPSLLKLRQVYRAQRAKVDEMRAVNQATLLAPFAIRLKQLKGTPGNGFRGA